jgi:hypothetical protein
VQRETRFGSMAQAGWACFLCSDALHPLELGL